MQQTAGQKLKPQQNWHALPVESTLAELNTTTGGLNHDEAEARLKSHGPNRLPEAPRQSLLVRFFLQFHNILIHVLVGSAIITAWLDH